MFEQSLLDKYRRRIGFVTNDAPSAIGLWKSWNISVAPTATTNKKKSMAAKEEGADADHSWASTKGISFSAQCAVIG